MKLFLRLFEHGLDFDISMLYPKVEFPVSRGTPSIAPLVKWNHAEDYYVTRFKEYDSFNRRTLTIGFTDKLYDYIRGHVVDGKNNY